MGRKTRILKYFKKFGRKYSSHPYIRAKLGKVVKNLKPSLEEAAEDPIKEEVQEKKLVVKKKTTRKKSTAKTSRTKRTKPKAE